MFLLTVPSSVHALSGFQRKCLHGQNLFPSLYPTYAMERTKGKLISSLANEMYMEHQAGDLYPFSTVYTQCILQPHMEALIIPRHCKKLITIQIFY